MNIPCEIIDDLLPLYEDQVCNPTTKEAVQSHLRQCARCREKLTDGALPPRDPAPAEFDQEATAVKRSFQKVRRVWIISLAVVLAVALVLGCGVQLFIRTLLPSDYDQCVQTGEKFIRKLCDGDFEEAAALIPFGYESEQWLEYNRQEFVQAMEDCKAQGVYFCSYDSFGGYDRTPVTHSQFGAPYYFSSRYNFYYYNVSVHLSSGEIVQGTISLAFQNGDMVLLTFSGIGGQDSELLRTALAHTELDG